MNTAVEISLWKKKYSTEQRRRLASEGKAMPDGSYPIVDKSDLSNAVQAFGRGGGKAGLKAFIVRRARALGATDSLPDGWASDVKKVETFSKPGTADVTPGDLKHLRPLLEHYRKMAHPFTACYKDQIKHGLSSDHAKRRCAVLKDLIEGTTHWRSGGRMQKQKGWWRGREKVVKADGTWTPEVVSALDDIAEQLNLDMDGRPRAEPTGALSKLMEPRKKHPAGHPC